MQQSPDQQAQYENIMWQFLAIFPRSTWCVSLAPCFVSFFCPDDCNVDIGQSCTMDQEKEGNSLEIVKKTGGDLRP